MATLVGEEGAGCFVFLWSVTLVFLGLFALPRGVVGRLSSLIVALPGHRLYCFFFFFFFSVKYRIRPNYRTYPYKRTVKQFRNLQMTDSVIFVYFFIKAFVVICCDTYLNCTDKMQFKWLPTTYAFIKKIRKKNRINIIK